MPLNSLVLSRMVALLFGVLTDARYVYETEARETNVEIHEQLHRKIESILLTFLNPFGVLRKDCTIRNAEIYSKARNKKIR
jgi:hypothetical protein